MYKAFRKSCERWFRIPPEPEPPPGDEASAQTFLAAPNYLQYLRVLWGIRNGLFLIFLGIPLLLANVVAVKAATQNNPAALLVLPFSLIILGLFAALILLSLAIVQLDYERRWYVVTDRSLRIREGVLIIREITFTFANIQNLSITQGPIQRMLGISDLKVETAGGGSAGGQQGEHPGANLHTAYFRGINNAEQVKELIALRMRGVRDAGLGDFTEEPSTMNTRESWTSPPVIDALEAVLTEAKALRATAKSA